jgi:hypothetical protein
MQYVAGKSPIAFDANVLRPYLEREFHALERVLRGLQVLHPITDDERTFGFTEAELNGDYPELDVRRYGETFDATHLQTAVDYWIAKGAGTLDGAGQTFDTGGTEIVVEFPAGLTQLIFNGNGLQIRPSATIDSGNGAGLKVTREPGSLVRNRTFIGITVHPTSGDCRGIEVDGLQGAGVDGFFYNLLFWDCHVYNVTRDAWRIGGFFFESWFAYCSARIPTNEAGYHCFALNAIGNDDTSGQLSSIEIVECNLSGGENNVNLAGAADVVKCSGGTYILAGKQAVKASNAGHREFFVDGVHIENPWSGASAVASGSWGASTNQPAITIVGAGFVEKCYLVSSEGTCRQLVYAFATGPVTVKDMTCLRNGSADFPYVCRVGGTSAGFIYVESSVADATNFAAVFDEDEATNVRYECHACPQAADQVSIKPLDNTGTPSVAGLTHVRTGGTTSITNLLGGVKSQEVTIYCDHAVLFDVTGTNLIGNAGVDFTVASGDLVIARTANGTTWRLQRIICA